MLLYSETIFFIFLKNDIFFSGSFLFSFNSILFSMLIVAFLIEFVLISFCSFTISEIFVSAHIVTGIAFFSIL